MIGIYLSSSSFMIILLTILMMRIGYHIGRKLLEAVPLIVLVGMVACSVPTGIIWRIYSNGEYVRGALFSSFAVLNLCYYLYAFVQTFYILITNNRRDIRYLLKSSVFSALPLIGILVNIYVIPLYGVYPLQPYCLVIGVLLAYLFMVEYQQNQSESEH